MSFHFAVDLRDVDQQCRDKKLERPGAYGGYVRRHCIVPAMSGAPPQASANALGQHFHEVLAGHAQQGVRGAVVEELDLAPVDRAITGNEARDKASGGVVGLAVKGEYLSVPASVGFIALWGIAVLNGVVLVSYIRKPHDDGLL